MKTKTMVEKTSSLHRNLPLLLLKTREGLMAHFRPILNEHGITEQQWRVMRVLDECGDLEPHELCRACCILSPSMAGILKRMEELDLVQKIRLKDQRRLIVKPTAVALELIQTISQQTEKYYAQIEQQIGTTNLNGLYRMLDDILSRLAEK